MKSRNCICHLTGFQVFAILSSRFSLYVGFRQRYESNMLDTIVAFIVMQKSELMLDVEQFGSRLDTIDLDNRPGTKYANSADVGAGSDKNNKRERLHVFIHRWIHKNIHANTSAR